MTELRPCPLCGNEIKATSRQAVSSENLEDNTLRPCPLCGAEIKVGVQFCRHCRQNLTPGQQSQRPPHTRETHSAASPELVAIEEKIREREMLAQRPTPQIVTQEFSEKPRPLDLQWEFLVVKRKRGFNFVEGSLFLRALPWGSFYLESAKSPWNQVINWETDLNDCANQLGAYGWELIGVTTNSDYLGGTPVQGVPQKAATVLNAIVGNYAGMIAANTPGRHYSDYAGFTSSETYLFKRRKQASSSL
jgi:hypothetical protein